MVDVSNRRREPKGIPTGGEFAREGSGAADASDLSNEALYALYERETREYLASLSEGELERRAAEEGAYYGGVMDSVAENGKPDDAGGKSGKSESKPDGEDEGKEKSGKPDDKAGDKGKSEKKSGDKGESDKSEPKPDGENEGKEKSDEADDKAGDKGKSEKKSGDKGKSDKDEKPDDKTGDKGKSEKKSGDKGKSDKDEKPDDKTGDKEKSDEAEDEATPDPARDRLWEALSERKMSPSTRARLARDPRLLAVAGSVEDARPVAVMGSWGKYLEWLGSDGRMHASPLASPLLEGAFVDMGGSSYSKYGAYSDRLKALRGHMSDIDRNAFGKELRRLRKLRVEAEAGLTEWTAADDEAERKVREGLAKAEEKAWPKKAKPKFGKAKKEKSGGRAVPGGAGRPAPRHPRLVAFMSTAGRVGAVVVGGFVSAIQRLLAPLGRR